MQNCVFCKIAEGQIPSTKVYESDELFAFEDVNPVAPVHILIIPKRHIGTINDVSEKDVEMLGKMFVCAKEIAAQRNLSEEGYRTVVNCMAGAGQSVFHVHMHVLGGRTLLWPPG